MFYSVPIEFTLIQNMIILPMAVTLKGGLWLSRTILYLVKPENQLAKFHIYVSIFWLLLPHCLKESSDFFLFIVAQLTL